MTCNTFLLSFHPVNSWRIREHILDELEATTGGRVIQSACKVGGVRKDISGEQLEGMISRLTDIKKDLRNITSVFLEDSSVKHRLKNVGILSKQDAYDLGAAGPTLRGSGVAIDIRETGYAAYGKLNFKPVVATAAWLFVLNWGKRMK